MPSFDAPRTREKGLSAGDTPAPPGRGLAPCTPVPRVRTQPAGLNLLVTPTPPCPVKGEELLAQPLYEVLDIGAKMWYTVSKSHSVKTEIRNSRHRGEVQRVGVRCEPDASAEAEWTREL